MATVAIRDIEFSAEFCDNFPLVSRIAKKSQAWEMPCGR